MVDAAILHIVIHILSYTECHQFGMFYDRGSLLFNSLFDHPSSIRTVTYIYAQGPNAPCLLQNAN